MASKTVNIVTFHGIGEPSRPFETGEERYWISEKRFLEILDVLAEFENVVITFDDGNRSDYAIAYRALRERGLVGSFFVLVGRLDTEGYLRSDEVRTLTCCGMRVGCHGMEHVPWTLVSAAELRTELWDAKARLEDIIGNEVSEAACPYGRYNRRVLRALSRCGFQRIYTSDGGVARESGWLLPRRSITREDRPEFVRSVLANSRQARFGEWARVFKRTLKRWS